MGRSLCWLVTLALLTPTALAAVDATAQPVGAARPAACHPDVSEGGPAPHTFGFDDMGRLWGVIDELKSGADPTPDLWHDLASGPGYSSLFREEIPKDILFESLRVAFLPSKQAKKAEWKDQGKPALRLVEHLIELDAKRQMVTDFLAELDREQATLSRSAMTLACGYFEGPTVRREKPFVVAFTAFQKDARGYGDTIVMDPLFALEAGHNLAFWLAHETHHLLRNPAALTTTPLAQDGAARSLAWVLQQLQSEGIADQIDKPYTFFGDGYMARTKFAEFFRAESGIAPERIAQLDALIRALADCARDCDGIGEQIRDTAKMAGHPLGYYMAGVIERSLGRAALLEDIGNPARFLAAYNRATKPDADHPQGFSERSLAYAALLFAEP